MIARIATALACAFAVFAAGPASAEEDSILILDASGSMWGQINKEAKITIAKRVLGDVVAKTPASRRLGLIAYGHRREGDCADIEEIAPVGTDRAAITAAVGKLNAKGKTPMTDSVKLAAEKLQYTKNKATIVLVSDGIETCAPDPCAAAAALEAAGIDLTVHVVGFDVADENAQAQLRCIAENTGGEFISAANANELNEALTSTVVEAPAAVPAANLYLRATELEGGIVIENGLAWNVKPSAGGAAVVSETSAGKVDATVAPGTYDVDVVRASDGLKGSAKGVVIQPQAQKTVTIALNFPVEATIAVEPASTGMAGTNVKVTWTGPDRRGDYVAIAKKEDQPGVEQSYAYTARGNPSEIRLPVASGTYEIRYVLGYPYRVLAKVDYVVTAAAATLTAPESAGAGSELSVEFTGPPANSSDYITITKPDARDNEYMEYSYTSRGSPAKLRAPLDPGTYELRFVQAGSKVLARRSVVITAVEASITATATVVAGEPLSVGFTGPPAGASDYITVTKAGAPATDYIEYAYTTRGSPAALRAPLDTGDYEIRYIQAGKKVLAAQALKVTAATATLSPPAAAKVNAVAAIAFTGPKPGSSDYIVVAEKGSADESYINYYYTTRGSPAQLKMPAAAGAYEIRFIQGGKKVLARAPITVTP